MIMIADDITGANDSGVQLARCGWKTTVMFDLADGISSDQEVILLDTDSRAVSAAEAYLRVKEKAELAKDFFSIPDLLFKKMDSTLRGNIGVEIDAFYDVFQPDFVVISPGYPSNGRKVMEGLHYLHDQLLHETEIAKDPKTPVLKSSVKDIVAEQSSQKMRNVPHELFEAGEANFQDWLKQRYQEGIPYLVFDSRTDEDLLQTVQWMIRSGYRIGWAGSAGLANALTPIKAYSTQITPVSIHPSSHQVLLLLGSVSEASRSQLAYCLNQSDVDGVALDAVKVVESHGAREKEINRVILEIKKMGEAGKHIAIYPTGDRRDIENVQAIGKAQGKSQSESSLEISSALAEVAAMWITKQPLQGLVLVGGDTTKQLFNQLHVKGMELIDEIEMGIPFGRVEILDDSTHNGNKQMNVITKAGAFGKETSLLNAIRFLEGEKEK